MKKTQRGFTVIELIVVIAIIAVISAIIAINTTNSVNKAKMARFNQDADNLKKALVMFYLNYGDYPQQATTPGSSSNDDDNENTQAPYIDETKGPYLEKDGNVYYLSEFLNMDWGENNATYYGPNGSYTLSFLDGDGNGTVGCIDLDLSSNDDYASKNILCDDCPERCEIQPEEEEEK